MGPCCVEGCTGVNEDTVYFEFPTSRGLRRKWLEMIKIPPKIPLGTMVCSQHFNRDDYEIVRGKVRLKRKVVPTLKLYNKFSKPPNPETTKSPPTETSPNNEEIDPLKSVNSEKSELPQADPITNPENEQPEESNNRLESKEKSKVEMKEKSKVDERELKENNDEEEICKVISKDDKRLSVTREEKSPLPDPKQPPDFEEMITNYQIKNNKPNTLLAGEIEIEVPAVTEVPTETTEETILVDDKGDAPPVFIEIAVDQDNPNARNQDCLMVLESVQVEVDPSSLMLPERYEDDDDDVCEIQEPANNTKDDPISLLTSSDEDDVIIQEPHIDTVEVSDATDEDDMPLVKLLKNRPSKKKKKPKKSPESLQKLVWTGLYDYYCMQCHFSTSDNIAYNSHLQEHQKVLQVCHICNYTTASKTQFARHVRKHKEEKKYKCHLCEYRARHNMSLIYHLQLHEKDGDKIKSVKKGFKCKKCGYRGDSKSAVQKHVRGCRVKKFACDQCVYVTKRKSDLKRHWMCRHRGKLVNFDSDCSYTPVWE